MNILGLFAKASLSPIITTIKEKAGSFASLGIMFGGNYLSSKLSATGAFEVIQDMDGLDHTLLFSKLQSGRFPTPEEVIRLVANRIEF